MQLWALSHSSPTGMRERAQRAEAAGWAGLGVVDSQCLAGDSYVALTLAAIATTTLRLGTGVTNTITRHPAVTASAAAALQNVSDGRIEIGIGRGDSALAHLGRAPVGLRQFEAYLKALQRYLSSDPIPFEELDFCERAAPPISRLKLADAPTTSRLLWLDPKQKKVPVEVAATGPKVIGIAARHADRVMLSVGASTPRIEWAMELARTAAGDRTPRFGAFVNLVCHAKVETARALVRGGLTTFARFNVMHGEIAGPTSAEQQRVLESLNEHYDMKRHTRADSNQAEKMSPTFIDEFAIVGPPEHCIDGLERLASLGIDKAFLIGPTAGADRKAAGEAQTLLEREVLPSFAS